MDPITARWDRLVLHPETPGEDTIVCCLTDDGQPVAVVLTPEHRRRLARELLDPAAGIPRPLPGGRRTVLRRRSIHSR